MKKRGQSPFFHVETAYGPAGVHLRAGESGRAAIVLGHGAGGGVDARDIVAVSREAEALGMTVVLVEQPYRVAGRRSPAPAAQLDAAWTAVVEHLRRESIADAPLIAGGRSSGARVACRTAAATGAEGVLCLAFPVHPPGRPEKSRLDELDGVPVPVLVIQGESDPFGMPPRRRGRRVVKVAGNHSLTADLPAVAAAARGWLRGLHL